MHTSFFPRSLWNLGWRYLLRHPWQSVLMVLGITLGVAVVVAIDLANASASRAFDLSTETVAGKATHQISGGPLGLDEHIFTSLRLSGLVQAAAPVISDYVSSPQLGDRPLQLLGIDPFSDAPFRNYLGQRLTNGKSDTPAGSLQPPVADLVAFLTQPGAIFISSDLASRYHLQACQAPPDLIDSSPQAAGRDCRLQLQLGGRSHTAYIAGLLKPSDSLSQRALDGLILADISTAQELTGRLGRIDRIDLILAPEASSRAGDAASLVERLKALLPPGARLEPVAARSGTVEQMTAAFQVNLTALSLLALVVGMFLIYNTMTFSVVQRRPLFGTLRCLGVTRGEVFALVISEALLVGVIGAGLGALLGVLMGQGAVRMVTQTINDLFFVLTVRGVQIPASSLLKGAGLGIAATVLTAAPPAWEAASVPPRTALSRSGLESKARRATALAAAGGFLLLVVGAGALLFIPTRSLVISFAGTFSVIVGCALVAPLLSGLLMRLATPILGRLWGSLGRMAPRDVINSLSRTAIAISALMVAVSVTIGVSLMVGSFRHTVVAWLTQTLQGDIYISAPQLTAVSSSAEIDPQTVSAVQSFPGVARADILRSVDVDSPQGPAHIAATNNFSLGEERLFVYTTLPPAQIWQSMRAGAVLVSEPLANRLNLPRNDATVTLFTESGAHEFPVVGVFYDYASTQGTVLMDLAVYRRLWADSAITAIALRLQPGIDADALVRRLQDEFSSGQQLIVRANRTLRQEVLAVFDRTFAITGALQLLATVVAFIGVLSALLSLELERQRELGILRAIGLTIRQLWGLILLETGLMGAVAGLLSMPTGYILALILVFIINRRSFGWTLQMQVLPGPFFQALAVAVTAALLAGIYPALRTGKMAAAEALRSE